MSPCIIGSLRYLAHTRPDTSFIVDMVSRFMEAPMTEHMSVSKHLLRYIAGMLDQDYFPYTQLCVLINHRQVG